MRYLLLCILLLPFNGFTQDFNYPVTAKVSWNDQYPGGITIEDPYHWLEDDNSLKTKAWVSEQNRFTRTYLDSIPGRDSLKARMSRNWSYLKYDVPFRAGSSYLYYRNDGLQNQPVLYYMKSMKHVPMSYFDPNRLSENGTTSIRQTQPNNSGTHLAFIISEQGSDWNEIRIKEVQSQKTLADKISHVKFSSVSWYGEGFFYSRYDSVPTGKELTATNTFHKVYYHHLNTSQAEDSLVFEDRLHPNRTYNTYVTPDEKFLVITGSESTSGNCVYLYNLKQPNRKPILYVKEFNDQFIPLGNIGNALIFLTDKKAPRNKIIKVEFPALLTTDLIQHPEFILKDATLAGNYIIGNFMNNATSKLLIYTQEGKIKGEIPLPGPGAVEKMNGSSMDTLLFFNYTSFTMPARVYRFNLNNLRMNEQFVSKLPFDPNDYVTEQVFYTSKDQTKIPMFLVYKKGLKKDGNTPVLVYGYGGFNISKTPEFKAERMVFLDNGGLIALPNLRGGGEYGRKWHEAGTKEKKQNVFDDCIAAAEWLIREGYTQPEKLALQGRSNGGLLVGAVMTQRPDLFKVALPAVGVLDMLRYHKFTIGWSWAKDYGTSDDSTGFQYLRKYSPYHNLKPGISYPATLITTADHDDRVVPAHSFKFAARLQEVQEGTNPVLIRIDTGAGHGAGKPTGKQIEEQTDIFTFLFYNLGMKL
jgi:prolyl oligopeptidase